MTRLEGKHRRLKCNIHCSRKRRDATSQYSKVVLLRFEKYLQNWKVEYWIHSLDCIFRLYFILQLASNVCERVTSDLILDSSRVIREKIGQGNVSFVPSRDDHRDVDEHRDCGLILGSPSVHTILISYFALVCVRNSCGVKKN